MNPLRRDDFIKLWHSHELVLSYRIENTDIYAIWSQVFHKYNKKFTYDLKKVDQNSRNINID